MNYFIDLGAYKGLYIKRFKEGDYYTPDTKIIAFECNPTLKGVDYGKDVEVVHKCAWVEDGEIDFYISKTGPMFVQGSSVYKNKITGNLDRENPIKMPCIDFSRFLSELIKENDNLIVKMNIEGAEYKILETLLTDGNIKLINTLFVSFHYKKINLPEERHLKLVRALRAVNGLEMHTKFGLLAQKRG